MDDLRVILSSWQQKQISLKGDANAQTIIPQITALGVTPLVSEANNAELIVHLKSTSIAVSMPHETKPTVLGLTYEQVIKPIGLPLQTNLKDQLNQLQRTSSSLLNLHHTRALVVLIPPKGIWISSRGKNLFHAFNSKGTPANLISDLQITTIVVGLTFTLNKPIPFLIEPAVKIAMSYWSTATPTPEVNTKIINDLEQLVHLLQQQKQAGKHIVLTNGCFDLLHPGHIAYLKVAKTLGDLLVVGVNNDASVKQIKGLSRPINPLSDRMEVLAGLESVDYVISFSEPTAVELAKAIKPDVYVKGGDYKVANLPEASWVILYGGEVKIIPYISNKSTTQLIQKIQHSPSPHNISEAAVHYDQ